MSSFSVPHWILGDNSFYCSNPKTLALWKHDVIKTKVAGLQLKSNYLRLLICTITLNVNVVAPPSKLQIPWLYKGSSMENRGHSVSKGDKTQNLELVRGHKAIVQISDEGREDSHAFSVYSLFWLSHLHTHPAFSKASPWLSRNSLSNSRFCNCCSNNKYQKR